MSKQRQSARCDLVSRGVDEKVDPVSDVVVLQAGIVHDGLVGTKVVETETFRWSVAVFVHACRQTIEMQTNGQTLQSGECAEVRWRPGSETSKSAAPPCSNLRSFGANVQY